MNNPEPTWLAPLKKHLEEVRAPQRGQPGLTHLMQSLAEMESLLNKHRAEMPDDLIHFLERRSYDKAFQFCQGMMTMPRGTCGAKA